ncbi:MAG: thioredoxin family protein [Akkermansia sp.]|nr:thioredoxin family protein [Akkermansia sp.]
MKHIILTICILLGLCTYALPMAEAQSDSPTATRSTKKKKLTAKEKREAAKAKKAAAKAEKEAAKAKKVAAKKSAAAKRAFDSAEPTSKVGQFLKAQTYATDARPNLEAKYYVVYRSSSTCGHCHKLMPQILEAHALMLASGKVDLIFDSYDGELSATTAYLEKNGATFAAVHNPAMQKMPGALHQYLILPPGIYIVDAEGNRLASGHAAAVLPDWKKHTLDAEKAAEE